MKTLRYLFAIAAAMVVGAVASAQTNLQRNNSTNEINVGFSVGGTSGRNTITWKTGSTGVFSAGSNLTVNGAFNGTPTGGTLDLSAVTVIGVSGGLSDGDKGDITVGGSGTTLTVDDGAITLAKMASMATASLLGRNTGGTGAPEVLSAATARSLLGLGGAALLNIGTGSGTAAAGDDARITGAVQSTRTISTTSPLSGGGDMSANRTFSIADAAADGATKGAAAFTSGHFSASSGVISLANSGVTAGTHGNSTHTPVIQVDAQGRVISLSNTSTSGGGGIGGNYTVTGNTIASSGNVTLTSGTDFNIVLDPGGTGVTSIVGAGNTTGNFTVGDSLTVTNNATFGNISTTNLEITGGITGTIGVTNGGTGRATGTTAYSLVATGTTATGAQQTLANGATTEILVGGGASALPVWTTATGSGAPVRATSPTLVTPALGTPTAIVLTSGTGLPISTGVSGLGAGVATALAINIGSNGSAVTSNATQTLTGKQQLVSGALATDDTWEGQGVTGLTAGATIAQWEAVYLDGSSTWQLADANGSGTYPAIGLAVAAYSSTNAAIVVTQGTVRNDAWAWTPGGVIYLSTTAGGLTQTAPSTSADKVQQIGRALTADIILVNVNNEYLTVQ